MIHVLTWSLLVSLPCWETDNTRHLHGALSRSTGAYEHSGEVEIDAASWAMLLEQGLALDELLGVMTSREPKVEGGSGGK